MGNASSSGSDLRVPPSSELLASLPLCPHARFYSNLEFTYPRPLPLRWLRWLFAHFAVDVLTGAGLATALAQQIVSALSKQGLAAVSVDNVLRSPLWLFVRTYPAYVACGIVLLLAFIPFGYRMRDDEKREAIAIARREAGERLAYGYKLYLDQLEQECVRLPPLLWGHEQDAASVMPPGMRFVPISLTRSVADNLTPLPSASNVLPAPATKIAKSKRLRTTPSRITSGADLSGAEAIALAHCGAIVVRAQAGAGKTMLLRQLALNEIERQRNRPYATGRTPFLLDLSITDLANTSFHTIVRERVRRFSFLDDDIVDRIVSGIEQGPSLVLIDGLDELKFGKPRQATLAAIGALTADERPPRESWEDWKYPFPIPPNLRTQATRIPGLSEVVVLGRDPAPRSATGPGARMGMQIVVGSRPAPLQVIDLDARSFEMWDLQPLTSIEIQRRLVAFVLSILEGRSERQRLAKSASSEQQPGKQREGEKPPGLDPNTLLALLNKSSQTRGWAANPLILTLAAVDWASAGGKRVAATRVALYRSAISELMMQRTASWSEQERVNLSLMAEDVALRMYVLGMRSLTASQFQRLIADTLPAHLLSSAAWPTTQELGGDLLLTKSGLFVAEEDPAWRGVAPETKHVQYNIYHRSFLEYLAARALARRMARQWPASTPAITVISDLRQLAGHTQEMSSPKFQDDPLPPIAYLWRRRLTDYWSPVLCLVIGVLTESTTVSLEPDLARITVALAIMQSLTDAQEDIGMLGTRRAAACMGYVANDDSDAQLEADRLAGLLVSRLKRAISSQDVALIASLQDACLQMAESAPGRQAVSKALVASAAAFGEDQLNRTLAELTLIRVRTEPDEARHQLYHPDIEQRVSAARAFEAMGQDASFALPDLRNRLADPDHRMRLAVVCALGALGPVAAPAIPRLLNMLNDDNDEVQTAAAEAIRRVGGGTAASFGALPLLVANLHDASPRTRIAILDTLGELGTRGAPVLAALLSNSTDPSSLRAIGSLGSAAEPAVPQLREILQTGKPDLRLAAADAVGLLTAAHVMPLDDVQTLLDDDDSSIRASAARSLGLGGISAETTLPYLIAALDDPSDQVRTAAAAALSALNARGTSILVSLAPVLESGAVRARIASIGALVGMGEQATSVVPAIAPLLGSPDVLTQIRALEALLAIGPAAGPLAGTLRALVNGPHQSVRVVAGLVLRQCDETAVKIAVDFERDHVEEIRVAALRAVAVLGAQARGALPDALMCLREPDTVPAVKYTALLAIWNMGLPLNMLQSQLSPMLNDQPDQVREAITMLLRAAESGGQFPIPESAFKPSQLVSPAVLAQIAPPLPALRSTTRIRQQIVALEQAGSVQLRRWHEYDWPVRTAILAILRDMHLHGSPLSDGDREILVASLMEELPLTRAMAATIIAEQPSLWRGGEDTTALIGALVDEHPVVSMTAITALAALESNPLLSLLPDLQAAVRSGTPEGLFAPFAQRRELDLIMALGPAAQNGLQRSAQLLRSAPHWSVRWRAAVILGSVFASRIEPEQIGWLARARTSDPSGAVRDAADAALARIMSIDPAAPDTLDDDNHSA